MQKQRLLRCPPDEGWGGSGLHSDPVPEIPEYKYSQKTFKSFTDEEIRNQAGKEALPEGQEFALQATSLDKGNQLAVTLSLTE